MFRPKYRVEQVLPSIFSPAACSHTFYEQLAERVMMERILVHVHVFIFERWNVESLGNTYSQFGCIIMLDA